MKNKRKVAVFDIDGTIFRSSLLIELVDELISDGTFPARARDIYIKAHRRWLDRKDSYDKYIMAVVAAFDKHIRGVREKDFLRAVRKVVAFHRSRVYRFTRDLVLDLRRRKYFLLAISLSPKYIVDGFAEQMGFNKVYGRILELDERGRFTGRTLESEQIFNKAKILRRAVKKENLTLRGSVGVGDTDSDAAFLSLVDKPICFNPNSTLRAIAKRRLWRVVVERKDVIYDINNR